MKKLPEQFNPKTTALNVTLKEKNKSGQNKQYSDNTQGRQNRMFQKNLQQLLETVEDFIFILDNRRNIVQTNPIVEKRLGYETDDLQGTSIRNVYLPERRNEITHMIDKLLAGELTVGLIPLYTKVRKEISVETRAMHGKWNGNNVSIVISRDISEKIKTNQELRRSETRWQFVQDCLGEGIWDWDIKTDMIFLSEQYLKMFGYSKKDAIGTFQDWLNHVHPDDQDSAVRIRETYLKGETAIFKNKYRILNRDGSYKWILDRAKVVGWDENGNPCRVIGVVTDISTQQNFENILIGALQREKELNELKSQLVSMASHEFRTPLATMLITADMLKAHWGEMSKYDIDRNIEKITNNIHFLKDTIEKAMYLSRVETGNLNFVPELTNLNDFLKKITEHRQKTITTGHKLNYQGTATPLKLKIDRQMIQQVILDLLSNSIKFSAPETSINIRLTEKGDNINIQISDTGIGIPESEKKYVFETFRRGSNVGNVHGTGLGLALANKLVLWHEGNITFTSQTDKGTVFTVSLPKNK